MTTLLPPICLGCSHFRKQDGNKFTCDAFPGGIPDQIINSEAEHRQPYKGDNDIQYLPKTPDDAAYADMLFKHGPVMEEWLPPKEWDWEEDGGFDAYAAERPWLAWTPPEIEAFLKSGVTVAEWLADRPKEFVEEGHPPNS